MAAKEIIKRNFSRCAGHYDRHSAVQNRSALRLIDKAKPGGISSILDIGCGTGGYTKLLRKKFHDARIVAVDISPEMIDIAKKKLHGRDIEFIVEDAEKIDFNEGFDLISSNSSFQWFENLEHALSKYRDMLREKGIISFSTFGPRTFFELNESLGAISAKNSSISSLAFVGKDDIEGMMKELFKKPEVEKFTYRERYASLPDLMKSIKYTGVRGDGGSKGFWTPGIVRRIESVYKQKFGGIVATYEVFVCRGIK